MKQSEQIAELASALSKAQGSFKPIYKNKEMAIPNRKPYFYADLSEIIKTVQPELTANGLSVCQMIGMDDKGALLTTRLMHSSGQWLEASLPLGSYAKHQDFGVECSYKRRYALCASLGIMADDDVDGDQGQPAKPFGNPPLTPKPGFSLPKPKEDMGNRPITEDEWKAMALKIKEITKCDKEGILAFVLQKTGKTSPKTLVQGDLLALENELGLLMLDKELPF